MLHDVIELGMTSYSTLIPVEAADNSGLLSGLVAADVTLRALRDGQPINFGVFGAPISLHGLNPGPPTPQFTVYDSGLFYESNLPGLYVFCVPNSLLAAAAYDAGFGCLNLYLSAAGAKSEHLRILLTTSDLRNIPTADAIASLAAARAWNPAYASPRTLTSSAAEVVSAVQGSKLVLTRGNSWLADVTGLGNITGWTKIWWTAKKSVNDSDAHAKVQLENPGGLLVVNGVAATPGDGSLMVLDAATGNVRLYIKASATKSLQELIGGVQGFQWEDAAGDVWPLPQGEFEIDADTTRAVD